MRALAFAVASMLVACGGAELRRPRQVPQPKGAFVEVPHPPPPAHVEVAPPSPGEGAAWVDGGWSWTGRLYHWDAGAWVRPPPGVGYAPWSLRRERDATLRFAESAWYDAQGEKVQPPAALAAGRARIAPALDASPPRPGGAPPSCPKMPDAPGEMR